MATNPDTFHTVEGDPFPGEEWKNPTIEEDQERAAMKFKELVNIGVDPDEARRQVVADHNNLEAIYKHETNSSDDLESARPTEAEYPLEDAA